MEVREEHKILLKSMGLKEDDFKLFDGKYVIYEFDEERGVRIYDPDYRTSYDEYIGIDGWSAWSSENDTFMSDFLKGVNQEMQSREKAAPKPNQEKIVEALQGKFDKKT